MGRSVVLWPITSTASMLNESSEKPTSELADAVKPITYHCVRGNAIRSFVRAGRIVRIEWRPDVQVEGVPLRFASR